MITDATSPITVGSRGALPRTPALPRRWDANGSSLRPTRHSPTPEPPGRQGLTSIDPVGRPLPSRRTRVARRVPTEEMMT